MVKLPITVRRQAVHRLSTVGRAGKEAGRAPIAERGLRVLKSGAVLREVETASPAWTYPAAQQASDRCLSGMPIVSPGAGR